MMLVLNGLAPCSQWPCVLNEWALHLLPLLYFCENMLKYAIIATICLSLVIIGQSTYTLYHGTAGPWWAVATASSFWLYNPAEQFKSEYK